MEALKDLGFVETGEIRRPKSGEYFIGQCRGEPCVAQAPFDLKYQPRRILKRIDKDVVSASEREEVCACYTEGKSLCGNKHSMNTIIHANVTCKKCLRILSRANDLITAEEIVELSARTKRITMKEALRQTMEGGAVPVKPLELKSGYLASYTIIDNLPNSQLEVFSVGARGKQVDPADAERLAKAILGEYQLLGNLMSKSMTHFMKKVIA